ncbi:MAG: transaldolase [Bryobacteraceae bacterium]
MPSSPLQRLQRLGQSVWLDFIDRSMLWDGGLHGLVEKYGITGITTNPKLLSDAILAGGLYTEDIQRAAREGLGAKATYERLAIADVRRAAGLLKGIYDRTGGDDGYVSLEVSPDLAYDTEGTVCEARALWSHLETPNVLVKIPATTQGLPAIRQMIAEGVNVNATLLFSVDRYRLVAEAYVAGLEDRLAEGRPIDRIHSVASFFVSRIDAAVDPLLERAGKGLAAARGRVALASARLAYQASKNLFGGDRFRHLQRHGARPQRLLWASTSPKDPSLSDLTYVEPLIGPGTVTTMPPATLEAYQDHGNPAARLEEGAGEAARIIGLLPGAGIDLAAVAARLEEDGVRQFKKPFDHLLERLGQPSGLLAVTASR